MDLFAAYRSMSLKRQQFPKRPMTNCRSCMMQRNEMSKRCPSVWTISPPCRSFVLTFPPAQRHPYPAISGTPCGL